MYKERLYHTKMTSKSNKDRFSMPQDKQARREISIDEWNSLDISYKKLDAFQNKIWCILYIWLQASFFVNYVLYKFWWNQVIHIICTWTQYVHTHMWMPFKILFLKKLIHLLHFFIKLINEYLANLANRLNSKFRSG